MLKTARCPYAHCREATARSQGTWQASSRRVRGRFGIIRTGPIPEIILERI
jgi:hypothetical protein